MIRVKAQRLPDAPYPPTPVYRKSVIPDDLPVIKITEDNKANYSLNWSSRKPFTGKDVAILCQMYREGKTDYEIAQAMGRSKQTVANKRRTLQQRGQLERREGE